MQTVLLPRRTDQVGSDGVVDGRPCWFGPTDRPLFGWVHGPARSGVPAVVLCPPLGRELGASYRALRRLAERLAGLGILAVRFDYDGTGDSSGSDADPGRVAAWLESVGQAAGLARSLGAGRLALVGLRAGALLAETAARRLGGLDGLVLWDPFASGKALVRHQRALQVLEAGTLPEGAGRHELLGFQLGPAEVADLAALAPDVAEGPAPARVLVLHRPKDPALGRLLGRLGPGATAQPTSDHEQFLDVASEAQAMPEASLALVGDWLAGLLEPETTAGSAGPSSLAATAVVGRGPAGEIREEARWVGPAGLFAVETRPERPGSGVPTVVFLNPATDHHVGPNRLWVHLARRWAELGVRSLRLDLSGIGDSPARPGRAELVVRSADAFDDVREVAEALSPDDPGDVVLVGLCSGAYQALESALELGARGVLAVNPSPVFNPPEMEGGGQMDPRRRICRPSLAAGLTYRRLVPARVRHHLRPLLWRGFIAFGRDRAAGRWLGRLVGSGTDTFIVCGGVESHQLLEGARDELATLEATGRLRIEVIEDLNHGLLPASQRDEVAARFTAHLVERFTYPQEG